VITLSALKFNGLIWERENYHYVEGDRNIIIQIIPEKWRKVWKVGTKTGEV
jgi:hypothetical protein